MKLWIARDFDGILNLFVDRPLLDSNDGVYDVDDYNYLNIDKDLFPEVTYENSPQKVKIEIIKE